MPRGEFGIPGEHKVTKDLDIPFPKCCDLRAQQVKREVRMHPPLSVREVAVTVHVLGENCGATHMRCHQSVAELIGVKTLGESPHMSGSVVFDMNLPPRAGPPCSDA